ncbi:MAG: TIGR04053 family radical SAM/SPASM domain-containing protein [Candidatus Omnitrophica bacterium]|nr:TIGR04053 family radical SAM/SPASM domain-containing protein [Candidatus Omnitrophota bacterium]
MPRAMDFDRTPFLVIWETTRACALACGHCRASAQPLPLPDELTTSEGMELVDQVADMGAPLLVLSGGDPLMRPDLPALIRHAKSRRLRVGTIPAATPRLTADAVAGLKDAGLDQMALSLDAGTPEAHDRFRGAPGAFHLVMQAAEWAHQVGLPLQINSVVTADFFEDFPSLMARVERLGVVFWEVFVLVPVGRGSALTGLSPQQCEELFAQVYALARRAPFTVKITEGMAYRRYALQQRRAASEGDAAAPVPAAHTRSVQSAPQTVNAGKGHVFVSCRGDICPSGFLPISAGNIRQARLADVYRDAPVFRELRDLGALKGRCGACEFRGVCGGSRARAYAVTGDYLAEDPACAYRPRAWGPDSNRLDDPLG